ncbi:Bromodomain-containing protein 9 [Saguinus oedipus]|uniref:Bromodomain-containing protein 9 n=1 Tax=Saguinus oedipus TaxID=9490 RepID=A0ABQ9W738_SAGOE|nr:Bromodomain-containing protein 9 [Saguinus oedipus]
MRVSENAAENESTPIQQLLEHFLRQLQRKDPHGFFAFPVTDAIAPGYSMIIKHPMDFGTMKDKIVANEYKSVTEFKGLYSLGPGPGAAGSNQDLVKSQGHIPIRALASRVTPA